MVDLCDVLHEDADVYLTFEEFSSMHPICVHDKVSFGDHSFQFEKCFNPIDIEKLRLLSVPMSKNMGPSLWMQGSFIDTLVSLTFPGQADRAIYVETLPFLSAYHAKVDEGALRRAFFQSLRPKAVDDPFRCDMLIPFQSDNHWVLVLVQSSLHKIIVYDSLPGNLSPHVEKFSKFMAYWVESKGGISTCTGCEWDSPHKANTPLQTDSFLCGYALTRTYIRLMSGLDIADVATLSSRTVCKEIVEFLLSRVGPLYIRRVSAWNSFRRPCFGSDTIDLVSP